MWGDLTRIRRGETGGEETLFGGVRRVEEGDKGHRRLGRREIAEERGSGMVRGHR